MDEEEDINLIKPSRRSLAAAALMASFVTPQDTDNHGLTHDAADITAAFARELEWIDAQIQREEFAPLKSELLIPYRPQGGPGVDTVTHRKVTEMGQAEFIGDGTTQLPRVDVAADEFSHQVKNLGAAWAVTIFQMLKAAANPTVHLETERKRAAFTAIKRLHDKTAFVGNTDFGWTGFVNDGNVPIVAPTTGDWLNAATTPQQIVADVNRLTWSIVIATLENHEAGDLVIPTTIGEALDQPMGDNADKTARAFILANSAHVKKIETSHYLETASATNGHRIIAYHKHPDVVRYGANELFGEEAPQHKGIEVETPCHGRSSGTEIRLPLAMAYMDLT